MERKKTIEQLHVEEAKEVVGVWLCPSGSNEKQIEISKEKVINLIPKLKRSNLSRSLSWKGYKYAFWQSVIYPLGGTTISKEEGEKL